ncbi:hypothetical protein AB0F43_00670 [Kribbella sp. NPDC023972]|uniref:LolA family protein n=1 Tax=Kribbella sp. NPDC023972 TaxID=3154795 RepID=UPI0033FDE904
MIAGVGTLGPVVADASPNLPDITAQELLTKVQTAKVDGLSGTVRSSADLGLPALPGVEGGNQIPDLLTGEHTARVAVASPDKARVSVLDNMAERVWTTDGKTAWAYDSSEREAVKLTLPARTKRPAKPEVPESYDPSAVAKQFLAAIDPTTKIEVSGTEEVAGRDAYKLRLVPKTDKSTVGSVTLAIDSKTWVPLEVTVMPRTGSDPAAQLGFSSVSFDVPAASTFAFTPPKGVKVKEEKVPATRQVPSPVKPPKAVGPKASADDKPTVIGEGWESVVAFRDVQLTRTGPVGQLLANARTVEGSWGKGKILSSKMVNALVMDDGRVLVGLVSPDTLVAAAPKAPR